MDGRLEIDKQFPYDEYKDYIISIIKPFRTKYEKFAVMGNTILCSNFFNTFFLEIAPINNPGYNFGFRIETEGKDLFMIVDPPLLNELMVLYYRIHNTYMVNKIYESMNLIEDNEEFTEINSHSSKLKSNLYKVDNNIITSMNGSYIKLNKADIVSLSIYQSPETIQQGSALFDYTLTKNKTKLLYHFISLNLLLKGEG